MGNNIVVVLLVHFVLVKICHIMTQKGFMLYTTIHTQTFDPSFVHYHHLCCEFEPHEWRGVLDKTLCDKSFSVTCNRSVVFSGYSISATKVVTEIFLKVV
jgi:hypothetical protein